MPYLGSAAGGFTQGMNDALDNDQMRSRRALELAAMTVAQQQRERQIAAMRPAGAALYQWAGQPTPTAPAGPAMPGVMPPPGGPMPEPASAPVPPVAPAGISAPPYQAMPKISGMPTQSDADAVKQATTIAAPPPAAAAAQPQPSLTTAPNVQQLLRLMKANGVPEDQVVDTLNSINPVFATEYKAAIGAAQLAEKYYRDATAATRADTQARDVNSKVDTRAANVDLRADENQRKRDTDAARAKEHDANLAFKKQELEWKKYAAEARNQVARERTMVTSSKSQFSRDKFNAQIDADRQFITQNPPGSEGAKNDFTYYSRVERAMTQKIDVDDPDYATWKTFNGKGEAATGGVLGAIRNFFNSGSPNAAPGAPPAAASPAPVKRYNPATGKIE